VTYGEATLSAAVSARNQLLGIGTAAVRKAAKTSGCMVRLDRVRPEPVAWLWPGRLFLGEVVLLVGEPAAGKSSVAMDVAARLTTGAPWPDGADNAPGSVVFVASEDSVATTLRPRFAAAGGRLRRAHHYPQDGTRSPDEELARLDGEVRSAGDVRLVVVDPVTSFAGLDINSEPKVRALLIGLKRLAERHRLTVLGVLHTNKRAGADAMRRMLGSVGFLAVPRAVYFIGPDPEQPGARLLAAHKFNFGKKPPAARFEVRPSRADPAIGVVRFTGWDVRTTADEMLRGTAAPWAEGSVERAERFLRDRLAGGPVSQAEVGAAAAREGIAPSTVRRAKERIGVRSFHPPDDRRRWWWELPAAGGPPRASGSCSPADAARRPDTRIGVARPRGRQPPDGNGRSPNTADEQQSKARPGTK
jgi:putative DNA primase/helicase